MPDGTEVPIIKYRNPCYNGSKKQPKPKKTWLERQQQQELEENPPDAFTSTYFAFAICYSIVYTVTENALYFAPTISVQHESTAFLDEEYDSDYLRSGAPRFRTTRKTPTMHLNGRLLLAPGNNDWMDTAAAATTTLNSTQQNDTTTTTSHIGGTYWLRAPGGEGRITSSTGECSSSMQPALRMLCVCVCSL
jgi:hypothetical protein